LPYSLIKGKRKFSADVEGISQGLRGIIKEELPFCRNKGKVLRNKGKSGGVADRSYRRLAAGTNFASMGSAANALVLQRAPSAACMSTCAFVAWRIAAIWRSWTMATGSFAALLVLHFVGWLLVGRMAFAPAPLAVASMLCLVLLQWMGWSMLDAWLLDAGLNGLVPTLDDLPPQLVSAWSDVIVKPVKMLMPFAVGYFGRLLKQKYSESAWDNKEFPLEVNFSLNYLLKDQHASDVAGNAEGRFQNWQ